MMKTRISLTEYDPKIAAEWHPTKNGELTPAKVTIKSNKKVWWVCNNGHEWHAIISNRTNGQGCPYCSSQRTIPGKTDLATVNPSLAAEWHPTKNGELTPAKVSTKSNRKVWWRCEKGHEWEAIVANRTTGSNCPYCSGRNPIPGQTDLATLNPKLASEWHPTKNGELTPQKVTSHSEKKVWWLGTCGHEWKSVVTNRASGSGCPYCAGHAVLSGFNDLATVNPKLAAQWHPTKNGSLTPEQVTYGSEKKVWWLCEKCGREWRDSVTRRTRYEHCSYCSNKKILSGRNILSVKKPSLAAQWHPTKNGSLTPEMVTFRSHKKVWWLCDKGHEWQMSVDRRTAGGSCPICKKLRKK